MDIRKKVYDMEVDGAGVINGFSGARSANFKLTSGMYKVRLIEKKQRQILAGLSEAEATSTNLGLYNTDGSEALTGTIPQFDINNPDGHDAEALIEIFREQGREISQSEADDLIAFERALAEE